MKIIKASSGFLKELIPLFDDYRIFYKQDSNPIAAGDFLSDRFQKKDSVIFLALDEEGKGLGFTQLYPTFSSVSMQQSFILNDLYVAEASRGRGVGEALMERAKLFARETLSKGLTLETGIDNPAQKLYERLGWVKDTKVIHYTWEL